MHKCPTCGSPILFSVSPGKHDFKTALQRWIEDIELEDASYAYLRQLRGYSKNHFLPFFKSSDVRSISGVQIKEFRRVLLKKGLSDKTLKNVLGAFQTFLFWMCEEELIGAVPRFPRRKKKVIRPVREKKWIDQETQFKVLNMVAHEPTRLCIAVMIETGIRPCEAAAVHKDDLREGGINICRALDERRVEKPEKNGKVFFRPLSAELYKNLCELSRSRPGAALLFLNKRGSRFSKNHLWRFWEKACAALGIKISIYQATRHSKASQKRAVLEERMLEELRRELEHSTAKTTLKHYALGKEKKI